MNWKRQSTHEAKGKNGQDTGTARQAQGKEGQSTTHTFCCHVPADQRQGTPKNITIFMITKEQQHHPSCTPNDISLVQHCNQCGMNEPYDHDEEAEAALHEELRRLRAELPLMRKENLRLINFLRDAAAFIRVSNSGKGTWNSNIVLATLIHDINGMANEEPCFVPRVTGYSGKQETP
jgi:hypothetical protein